MRFSQWRSWIRPTPLELRLMALALMRDFATRHYGLPSSASFLHLTHLSLCL
jgi:hypothetical protein